MAYRMSLADPAAASLTRIAGEELDDAVAQLEHGRAGDPVEAIHDARKDLKKLRSLLRLARSGMDDETRRAENLALGDAGRALSGGRDADVMVETVAALAERFSGQVPATMFAGLHDRLAARAARHRGSADDVVATQVAALREARRRLVDPPAVGAASGAFARVRWKDVVSGAARAYARGRAAYAAARKDPSTEALHEWRKRVKDAWYHARLLHEIWPPVMHALASELKELSQLLGDDHDLAVLGALLRTELEEIGTPVVDEAEVLELVARRRAELQSDAFALGARLYADRPRAWERRLSRIVSAAV